MIADVYPVIWPFMRPEVMPPDNVGALHLLLFLHTLLTLLAFLAGPIMIWRALRDRADALYWGFAALPLVIEGQRLAVGNHCIVQDLAHRLWEAPAGVWAPDLYGVHASWVTYVVDACIVSYAGGVIVSLGLFLHRRRGWFRRHTPNPISRATSAAPSKVFPK
ncbi:MAG: hypothetical protein V2I43_26375 [Parvularcula sp.]|jgi:hypothetical protein|nr:hypothetical protein [Parvularcula sp.]